MKRALHLLLLFGALIGLFGQEVAFAAGPQVSVTQEASYAMFADCMEMMQKERPQPAQKPCKGLTLDCIAAMGCIVPLATAPDPDSLGDPLYMKAVHFVRPISPLLGRSVGPEPDPPTFLI